MSNSKPRIFEKNVYFRTQKDRNIVGSNVNLSQYSAAEEKEII